ncbi:glycosyltransferase family 39 protein [Candidatus Daviesbacteria bacterium]|nr:glycosyltransferase family 39 protein [Candidatus Daviesbacteria bacterium]
MKLKNPWTILISILIFAAFLRGVNLWSNPPALYGDELTLVYDTYSILKTGQDQLGNFLPLTFPMGAGRPGGYIYFSLPFVLAFGPSELGIRMLSFLSGIGIIILTFFVCRKLFSTKVALASSFLASISIWEISLSRGGFEAHFALFLALLGVFSLIKASQKPIFYMLSAASFGLTVHTYPTYKLTLVLFLPLLLWFLGFKNFIKQRDLKYILPSLLLFIFFVFLSILQTFTTDSEYRLSKINVFSQEKVREQIIQKINYERNISNLPSAMTKVFHNKPVEYGKIIGENYLKNFSADFLFIHGDRNPRHNMATMGQLYIADIVLLLFAFLFIKDKGYKLVTFLLLWVGIGALGSIFIDEPHALRNSFMLPPLLILSGFGVISFWENNKGKKGLICKSVLAAVLVTQFAFFIQKLYFLSPDEYSHFWSYPAKQASEIALSEKDNFKYILISDKIDNIEYAYPVYAKADPNEVISQNKQRKNLAGYQLKKIGNVYIGNLTLDNIEQLFDQIEGNALFIGSSIDQKANTLVHKK